MAFDFLNGFVHDVRAARRVANDIERMNRMSSAELAHIGLERSDITRHAFNKHFNRR